MFARANPEFVFLVLSVVFAGLCCVCDTSHAANKDDVPQLENRMGVVSEGFVLTAELESASVVVGNPVMLKLVLWNASKKKLVIDDSNPTADYSLHFFGATPPVVVGSATDRITWRNVDMDVEPGQKIAASFAIDKKFQLTPGIYKFVATRAVRRLDGNGYADVVSNSVELTILPKSSQIAKPASAPSGSRQASSHSSRGKQAKDPMINIRGILEREGFVVHWDSEAKMVTAAAAHGCAASIVAGSRKMVLRGESVQMGRSARIDKGRIYVPKSDVSRIIASCSSEE